MPHWHPYRQDPNLGEDKDEDKYKVCFLLDKAHTNFGSSAAWTQNLGGALSNKEHTLYLSFLGPNNPPLSSPKFGSCL